MASHHPLRASLALLALTGLASAQSGGIEIFAGETLFAQGTRVSIAHLFEQRGTLYRGSEEIPDPQDRRYQEQRVVLGYNYGLRSDVTLAALVPFVGKELRQQTPGGIDSDAAYGLGDIALMGKWRFYRKDAPRTSTNFSLVGGVETPTGRTGVASNGQPLPAGLQPGSGSWDPFLAVAGTYSYGRFRADAQVLGKWNTEGTTGYESGDDLVFSLSGAYRFWHEQYPGPSHSAKLGLLWRDKGSATQYGQHQPNSGYTELILRPGFTFHPSPGIDIVLAVDLPIDQNYEGVQLGLDFRSFAAIGIRF